MWIEAANGEVPTNAINCNIANDSEKCHIARAKFQGNLYPASLVPSQSGCYITHEGNVVGIDQYEVLCSSLGCWVPSVGRDLPRNALVVGYTSDGETLYVGRVLHSGTIRAGKVQSSKGCCYIAYNKKEIGYTEFEVYVPY